ncbi:MAG: NADP-dependent oxidoreductase [Actinophytocola sp.]|uniref:NADP-dependent oxidoreductase n=1 Tax=Actinophytocola sp. TaxID=1872138 RepID=UPI003D6C2D25
MAELTNRRIMVAATPEGELSESHFRAEDGVAGEPGPGEVLVRSVLLSIDPANRAWLQGRTYREQVRPGDVMAGLVLGEVVAENGAGIPVGGYVTADGGWQQYAVLPAKRVAPVEVVGDLTHHLGVFGMTGLTAYFGLFDVGRPAAGETVLVSAAAGATGSVVGQLARIHGCRVVGVTGSAAKNEVLTSRLGFDAAIDHRSPTFADDLREACPNGVDVYFDNVGGPVLDAALRRMNTHGRIVCCGVVSQYDTAAPAAGPDGVPGLVVTKRLRMEGFLVFDYAKRYAEGLASLAEWVRNGSLIELLDVVEGLDNAPRALMGLLAGENVGKRIVRVGPDRL